MVIYWSFPSVRDVFILITSHDCQNGFACISSRPSLLINRGISPLQRPHYFTSSYTYLFSKKVILLSFLGKHPTPMTIQLHPQCLLGIQGILRNWTFLIFKQV